MAERNKHVTSLEPSVPAVLVVLTSGPCQRPVKVTTLQFDQPSQLAPIFIKETVPQATWFPGLPPSGGRTTSLMPAGGLS
jgi:hypothetical protein